MWKGRRICESTKTHDTRELGVYVEGYGDVWEYKGDTRE